MEYQAPIAYFNAYNYQGTAIGTTSSSNGWQILDISTPGYFAIKPIGS
jgi:hypothetical protein